MTLLHSSEYGVSVRVERNEQGQIEISIKGPTSAGNHPRISYNNTMLQPIAEDSLGGTCFYGRSGITGGVGSSVAYGGAGGTGGAGSSGRGGGCSICGSSEPHGHGGGAGGGQSPDAGRMVRAVVHKTHAELTDLDET